MSLLLKSMGILWLFAEGLIMLYVRKGYRVLTGGEGRQQAFFRFCTGAFILLVFLRLAGTLGMEGLPGAGGRLFGFRYYNGYVWNLYCTLWVVIEGVIVIYVFRIYRLIRAAADGGERHVPSPGRGPLILTLVSLALYAGYHGHLTHLISAADLSRSAVHNLLRFYIKICGLFWILFEWYVALAGIRIFLLMKRHQGGGR